MLRSRFVRLWWPAYSPTVSSRLKPSYESIEPSARGWPNQWAFGIWPFAIVSIFIAIGCESHSGSPCGAGRYCACGDGPDCYLQCNADACNLECSHTSNACGSICGNQCVATCHDTNDCSSMCGDGCSLECHNVVSCAAQCGANCVYSCHDATDCAVRVGPASTVSCDHLGSCEVECAGACTVTCTNLNDANNCSVTCAAGHTRTDNGNGTITCN